MSAALDLAYLRLAVPDLPAYLQSPAAFWPLPSAPVALGQAGLPQLTLGGVLLGLARLNAAEPAEVAALQREIEEVHGRWRATWARKAAREHATRLELWRKELDGLLADPAGRMTRYPARVSLRVMLDLLAAEMASEAPAGAQRLVALDERLRAATRPGPFVWEPCFAAGFPEPFYWYLYIHF